MCAHTKQQITLIIIVVQQMIYIHTNMFTQNGLSTSKFVQQHVSVKLPVKFCKACFMKTRYCLPAGAITTLQLLNPLVWLPWVLVPLPHSRLLTASVIVLFPYLRFQNHCYQYGLCAQNSVVAQSYFYQFWVCAVAVALPHLNTLNRTRCLPLCSAPNFSTL